MNRTKNNGDPFHRSKYPLVMHQNKFPTTLSGDIETMIFLSAMSMEALYDNSKAFDMFLRKQGMDGILRETNLKTRATHTIVPHVRIHTRNTVCLCY